MTFHHLHYRFDAEWEKDIINSRIMAERNHMTATISQASQRFAASHNNRIPFKRTYILLLCALSEQWAHINICLAMVWQYGMYLFSTSWLHATVTQTHTHTPVISDLFEYLWVEILVFDSVSAAQSVYYTIQLNIYWRPCSGQTTIVALAIVVPSVATVTL